MSVDRRRTAVVRDVIEGLFASGKTRIHPGDVNSALREKGLPMGTWEVRAEFTRLEEEGVIVLDPATAEWMGAQTAAPVAKRAGG